MNSLKPLSRMAGVLHRRQTSQAMFLCITTLVTLHRSAPHQWLQPAPRSRGSSRRAKLRWGFCCPPCAAVTAPHVELHTVVRLGSGLSAWSCCNRSTASRSCHGAVVCGRGRQGAWPGRGRGRASRQHPPVGGHPRRPSRLFPRCANRCQPGTISWTCRRSAHTYMVVAASKCRPVGAAEVQQTQAHCAHVVTVGTCCSTLHSSGSRSSREARALPPQRQKARNSGPLQGAPATASAA